MIVIYSFDEKSESWRKEYAELKELLTPEEYREARATVTTAFYTPPAVAAAVGEPHAAPDIYGHCCFSYPLSLSW